MRSRAPSARCSTSRSRRSCSHRDQGLAEPASPRPAASLSRNPSATIGIRAYAGRRTTPVYRRVAAVSASTTTSGRWASKRSCTCGSRTRCSSRYGTGTTSRCVQITMAEDFGVEDRGHFYDPVGALRDVVVNHLMQVVAAAAMEAAGGRRPATPEGRAKRGVPGRSPPADPADYVRGQYDGYRDIDGVAADSTTETYAALGWTSTTGAGPVSRSSSAPANACRSRRPSCGSCSRTRHASASVFGGTAMRARPARGQARSLDRHPLRPRCPSRRRGEPGADQAGHDVRRGRRRGRDAVRGAAPRRDGRPSHPIHPAGRRRGDVAVMQPLLDAPPQVHPYDPGSWGPTAAEGLVAECGGWRGPWVES